MPILSSQRNVLRQSLVEPIEQVAVTHPRVRLRRGQPGGGFVGVHSHEISDAVLLAANLGEDADTTAAVCGQVAGAYYGESGSLPLAGAPGASLHDYESGGSTWPDGPRRGLALKSGQVESWNLILAGSLK